MRLGDGIPHRTQTLALGGRDKVHRCELQKPQASFQRTFDQLALVFVHRVPLVHRDHHGTPRFEYVARNMRVLVGYPLNGINKKQDDVSRLDGLQGLDDRKLFDSLKNLAFAAQTCRVN